MAPKKNENAEWQETLQNGSTDDKRATLQAIIVAMTSGRDVAWLFTDVVKCIFTKDLELKKLIYLYIMNYAKSQPELAILAVNAFLKDAENPDSSIIRALAIRTMSSIPLTQISDYLVEPLIRGLKDTDPYVRKTAVLAAAKLHELNPSACEDAGILDLVQQLTIDSNQAVVANAAAALLDISKRQPEPLAIQDSTFQSFTAAIEECNEWGLAQLLESVIFRTPQDQYEAAAAAEKIATKLQHANSAVVINAIKAILHLVKFVDDQTRGQLMRRIMPPFVTLLSTESAQVQYLALRSVASVLVAYPGFLNFELRVFLPKYHDPLYVKMEKLDLLLIIATEENGQLLLTELKDYCFSEVEAAFVKKCVVTIGKVAVKINTLAGLAVQTLVDLVKKVSGSEQQEEDQQVEVNAQLNQGGNTTSYTAVAQEALVAIRDVIRCYPGYFEGAIIPVLGSVTQIDDPEARCALFYIVGEHAAQIENVGDLLRGLCENFQDEPENVQLALLTASVKVFLAQPNEETQEITKDVLAQATSFEGKSKLASPDVRERGFFYWRLLSVDLETARRVVFGATVGYDREKATKVVDGVAAFNSLVPNLGAFSSINRQAVRRVVKTLKADQGDQDDVLIDESEVADQISNVARALGGGPPVGATQVVVQPQGQGQVQGQVQAPNLVADLLAPAAPAAAPAPAGGTNSLLDF